MSYQRFFDSLRQGFLHLGAIRRMEGDSQGFGEGLGVWLVVERISIRRFRQEQRV
jgi:hypothetical protein